MIEIYTKEKDGSTKLAFKFLKHEMPESFPTHYSAVINEIKYPGAHFGGLFANQVMGVYFQPIEFSGTFKGTLKNGSKFVSVQERAKDLINLVGRVVIIKIPDDNGSMTDIGPGQFILKDFKPNFKMGIECEYSVTFIPHQHQSKVKDIKTEKITINVDLLVNANNSANKRRAGIQNTGPGTQTEKKKSDGWKTVSITTSAAGRIVFQKNIFTGATRSLTYYNKPGG